MNLYLIRHSTAVAVGTAGYADDSQRPLTEEGSRRMLSIARGLRALGTEFDLILSSPYLRTRQTAAILAEVFVMKDGPVNSVNLRPMGESAQLISEINQKYKVDKLALVGHEPLLSALISLLVAGNDGLFVSMKAGGVCCLALDTLRPGRCASLEWLMTPVQLARLGEQAE